MKIFRFKGWLSLFFCIFAGGMNIKKSLLIAILLAGTIGVRAQQALDIIRKNPSFAVTNYALYPDSAIRPMTPPPAGKKPFYLSHYGRHGSRYINKRMGYDIPYIMMCRADSLGQLTPTGGRPDQLRAPADSQDCCPYDT